MKRRLIESRPSLKILLEDEDPLADLFADDSGDESKDKGDDEENKEEGGDEAKDESGDTAADAGGEAEAEAEAAPAAPPEESEEDKRKAEEEKEKEIEKAVKKATKTFNNIVSYANLDPNLDTAINKKLYSFGEAKINRAQKRLNESITKYLFKDTSFKNVHNRSKISMLNNFSKNSAIINKISNKLNESADDIISDKFWNENASVDVLVDNAIDLTIHFEDQIDIPEMIMNSVAVKFGKMAAEKVGEEPNVEAEYKEMLDEFMSKYLKKLTQSVDYENYDTTKIRLSNPTPDIQAVGAMNKA